METDGALEEISTVPSSLTVKVRGVPSGMNATLEPTPVNLAIAVLEAGSSAVNFPSVTGTVVSTSRSGITKVTESGAPASKVPSMAVLSETLGPHATAAKAATAARMNDLRLIFMNINVQPFPPRSDTTQASRFSATNVKL